MRLMCDPLKNATNLAKHGIPLMLAEALDWPESLIWTDVRRD